MLTKIVMRNFTSFKNDTTIDFVAKGYKILDHTNVFEGVLKGGMFVGANASGKTNITHAIKLLMDLLFAEKLISLPALQCLFSKETTFELQYFFTIENNQIHYVIEYDAKKSIFVLEKLIMNDEVILNRIGNSAKTKITQNDLIENIDKDAVVLREIYFNTKFRSYPILKKWFDYLLNSVYVDGYKGLVYSPGKYPLEIMEFIETPKGVETINSFFEKFNFNQRIEYSNSSKGPITRFESDKEKSIFFKREGVGEPIPFSLESLGNQLLLNFLPPLFHVIENSGMLIVDEFSSGMHNFLEELLIRHFMINSCNSQMIFVSHSTNLLSNSILRPDQIYSVDFMGINGSRVLRFSSQKPREAQNIEKMYTSGIFGGVPKFQYEKIDPKQ